MSERTGENRESLSSWIAGLSARLASEAFGPGERAQLRRNDPATVAGQPVFHRLMAERDAPIRPEDALRWATLVHVVAITVAHGATQRAGAALAAAGLSEARFTRLMAARDGAFRDQLVLAARLSASKQVPIHWGDLAELLMTDPADEERAAERRFRVAQSYYRELRKQDQPAPAA